MMAWACIIAVVLMAASGCGKKSDRTAISRDRDAAAVVVVQRTPLGVSFTDEVEPNDTSEQAGALDLPGGIRGTLDGEADVDLYRLTVSEPGWLALEVSGIDGVDLILELRDDSGASLARSDRGPARTIEGVPNYRVEKGRYLVAVSEFVKKRAKTKRGKGDQGRTGRSPTYELTATLASTEPEPHHEREPNQGAAEALELPITTDGFGFIGWRDDVDRWRISVEGLSEEYGLDIDLTPVEGVQLTLEVLDDNGDPVLSRKGDKSKAVAVRSLARKPGHEHYYVRISGRGSNPIERYALRFSNHLLDLEEEREPNDDRASATPVWREPGRDSGTASGRLLPGDVDWFALTVPPASQLTITVSPPAEVDVALAVANKDGGILGESDAEKVGGREALHDIPVSGSIYIIVKGQGSADTLEPYELSWSLGFGAPAPAAPDSRGDPSYDPYDED
ncbi:MAG TPA: hypothetical protein VML75_28190 [Kofleriaceae bacterium]|nr:hypothetical protein [Kofleriaceae bacterium]